MKTLQEMMDGGFDAITWPPDGEINIIYIGQEMVETKQGDRCKLAVYDLLELKETAIYTQSKNLLNKLFTELKVQANDKVVIKRTGNGYGTKYEAAILERANEKTEQTTAIKNETIAQEATQTPASFPKPKKFKLEDGDPF